MNNRTPLPYLPNTEADRTAMLREIGVKSVADLFCDIPKEFRDTSFNLPPALSEFELKKEFGRLANSNVNPDDYACFLGAGSYRHFIPSIVDHIIGRSEFYTAYTPYQAEVSQGTLQSVYEFQSLICQLTGMEVSNAGMYDGSTSAAEAAMMACAITNRSKAAVLSTVHPTYREVLDTYCSGKDIPLVTLDSGSDSLPTDLACLIVQQPNFFGHFEPMEHYVQKAHDTGALLIAVVDPTSLGMFRPPGEYGVDITVGEGQPLGIPASFGGPYLGIFACRKDYVRRMPGRIVGKTVDVDGNPGYVMTLVTREQHIRREQATSNICTSQALMALAAAVYLAAMGKQGLRQVAELCYHKAHYAADAITKLKGYSLVFSQPFFKEFAVRCPVPPSDISKALYKERIIGGLDISHLEENAMLLCVTEVNTRQEIDKLVKTLGDL